jgi:hypothetical protein
MTTRAMTPHCSTTLVTRSGSCLPDWALVTLIVGSASAVAVGSALVAMIAVAVAVVLAMIGKPAIRAAWRRAQEHRRRRRRHERREQRLGNGGVDCDELKRVAGIVDRMIDGGTVLPLDVELLLDRYVELATARQRCFVALAHADPSCLEAKLAAARFLSVRNADVLERRLAHARALASTSRELDQQIAELVEVISYCGQRAECPLDAVLVHESDVVASAVAYYDAYDAVDGPADVLQGHDVMYDSNERRTATDRRAAMTTRRGMVIAALGEKGGNQS